MEYAATKTVHWPTGPVHMCDTHAEMLVGLGNFLGSHIAVTTAPEGSICQNCQQDKADEE